MRECEHLLLSKTRRCHLYIKETSHTYISWAAQKMRPDLLFREYNRNTDWPSILHDSVQLIPGLAFRLGTRTLASQPLSQDSSASRNAKHLTMSWEKTRVTGCDMQLWRKWCPSPACLSNVLMKNEVWHVRSSVCSIDAGKRSSMKWFGPEEYSVAAICFDPVENYSLRVWSLYSHVPNPKLSDDLLLSRCATICRSALPMRRQMSSFEDWTDFFHERCSIHVKSLDRMSRKEASRLNPTAKR